MRMTNWGWWTSLVIVHNWLILHLLLLKKSSSSVAGSSMCSIVMYTLKHNANFHNMKCDSKEAKSG